MAEEVAKVETVTEDLKKATVEDKGETKEAKNLVLVTGGTGFIAGHVIEACFKAGLRVRATVRGDLKDKRLDYLRELADSYKMKDDLEFMNADLDKDGAFDEPAKGCWGVIHVASPVVQGTAGKKNPKEQFVEPAIKGTLSLLKGCKAAGVKRIVITSSVAIVSPDPQKHGKSAYTETDKNCVATLEYDPYSVSKMEAAAAMEKWLSELPESERPRVVTIHPGCVWGPQQNASVTSSNQIIRALANGEYPLAPPLVWPPVDVRDVAAAHVLGLTNDNAKGRYIVCNPGCMTMSTLGKYIKSKYAVLSVPSMKMPVWLLRFVSHFDHRIQPSFVDWSTKFHCFDGSKITKELGFKYQYGYEVKEPNSDMDPAHLPEHLQKTIDDTIDSFFKFGICKQKK